MRTHKDPAEAKAARSQRQEDQETALGEGAGASEVGGHLMQEVERSAVEGGVRVSISPMELMTHAYGVKAVRLACGDARGWNGQFYSRCDDLSAVMVMAAGRARSPAMAEALRIVREAEIGVAGERRLRSRLEHIGTHDNKVADLLSRGLVSQAVALVEGQFGVGSCRIVELPEAYLRETEERVCSAFLRDEEGTR